jgi:indole-3-glycerol phosphate synthase
MSVLQEIVKNKKQELEQRKRIVPLDEVKARARGSEAVRPLREVLRRKNSEPLRLIAELKKASPSEGRIRQDFNVSDIISIYDEKDVSAISVLTEERYFEGSLDYLAQARAITKKPLLRKDFLFDDYQVYESRASGADALLLIVASLAPSQLEDLLGLAGELSLECLVEVHTLKELDTALSSGAELIGINNRDLKTLTTNLNITFELLKDIPADKIIVSESGIHTRQDIESIESSNVDAVLVGTTIMRTEDIGAKIDELMGKF